MEPTKQKKRDQRLSNKEKSVNRRKERDRRNNHVQKMFSEATHEHTEAGFVTNDLKSRGAVAFQKVWRSYVVRMGWHQRFERQAWINSESDDWHDEHRRQREDDNDDALRR